MEGYFQIFLILLAVLSGTAYLARRDVDLFGSLVGGRLTDVAGVAVRAAFAGRDRQAAPVEALAGVRHVDRDERDDPLPGGVADLLVRQGAQVGATEAVVVSVLMSDIRGYSSIAERADPR